MKKELPYIEQKPDDLPEIDWKSLNSGIKNRIAVTMKELVLRFNKLTEINAISADKEKYILDPGIYLGSGGAILTFLKYIHLLERDGENSGEAKKIMNQILEMNKDLVDKMVKENGLVEKCPDFLKAACVGIYTLECIKEMS